MKNRNRNHLKQRDRVKWKRPTVWGAGVLVSAWLWCGPLAATKTQRWELGGINDFMRGRIDRLVVNSDGELRPGYGHVRLGEFAREIWCSMTAPDGTIYFGTGAPAEVYRLNADGQTHRILETDAIAVTALALDAKGNLVAGTLADGKLYRLTPERIREIAEGKECKEREKVSAYGQLESPYVWALTLGKDGRLYAGTGPDGKVYVVEEDGTSSVWFESVDANILSLAWDAGGVLLAGGSDRGLLYRIEGKGKGTVLHEFAEDEIKSLAVVDNRLYIGVNRQKTRRPRIPVARVGAPTEVEQLTQRMTASPQAGATAEPRRDRETPTVARMANLLSGALYVRQAEGRFDKLAGWENESVLDLKVDGQGRVLAALAGEGRVYRVSDRQQWELLFDFDESQALTMAMRDGQLAFVGTGNVGAGYRVDKDVSAEGTFTSDVYDAKFASHWGNVFWRGTGAISISTRSGNTRIPDELWSEWSAPLKENPSRVTSPPGRFVQMRAVLSSGSNPVLRTLTLHLQSQNQKPEIASLSVDGEAAGDKSVGKTGATTPRASADGAMIDVSATAKTSAPAETVKVEAFRPRKASTTRKISWTASDRDGDSLVYRLYYRAEDDDVWVPMTLNEPLKKNEHTWETDSIPSGWYRVKLVASDEESNADEAALSDERISVPVKVDNRRPVVEVSAFDVATGILTGVARDDLSLIAFFEYAINGGNWKFFAPVDGVFDAPEEKFSVVVPGLMPGVHHIAVRATDEEGNIGVEHITVRVAPK